MKRKIISKKHQLTKALAAAVSAAVTASHSKEYYRQIDMPLHTALQLLPCRNTTMGLKRKTQRTVTKCKQQFYQESQMRHIVCGYLTDFGVIHTCTRLMCEMNPNIKLFCLCVLRLFNALSLGAYTIDQCDVHHSFLKRTINRMLESRSVNTLYAM